MNLRERRKNHFFFLLLLSEKEKRKTTQEKRKEKKRKMDGYFCDTRSYVDIILHTYPNQTCFFFASFLLFGLYGCVALVMCCAALVCWWYRRFINCRVKRFECECVSNNICYPIHTASQHKYHRRRTVNRSDTSTTIHSFLWFYFPFFASSFFFSLLRRSSLANFHYCLFICFCRSSFRLLFLIWKLA